MWLCYLSGYASSYHNCLHSWSNNTATFGPTNQCWQKTLWLLVLFTFSNFPVILAILFGKIAKSAAIAVATLLTFSAQHQGSGTLMVVMYGIYSYNMTIV
jgi:hypothetical protein